MQANIQHPGSEYSQKYVLGDKEEANRNVLIYMFTFLGNITWHYVQ